MRPRPPTSQHLEGGGVGEGEAEVHDGGGAHVAEGGHVEDEGRELGVLSLLGGRATGPLHAPGQVECDHTCGERAWEDGEC